MFQIIALTVVFIAPAVFADRLKVRQRARADVGFGAGFGPCLDVWNPQLPRGLLTDPSRMLGASAFGQMKSGESNQAPLRGG